MHMDMCPPRGRSPAAQHAHTHTGNKNTPAPSVDTRSLNTQTLPARATPAPRKRRGVLAHSTFAREAGKRPARPCRAAGRCGTNTCSRQAWTRAHTGEGARDVCSRPRRRNRRIRTTTTLRARPSVLWPSHAGRRVIEQVVYCTESACRQSTSRHDYLSRLRGARYWRAGRAGSNFLSGSVSAVASCTPR